MSGNIRTRELYFARPGIIPGQDPGLPSQQALPVLCALQPQCCGRRYALYVGSSAGTLGGVVASLIQASGASARVFALMDRQPAIDLGVADGQPQGRPEGGHLQLQDVWFAYR